MIGDKPFIIGDIGLNHGGSQYECRKYVKKFKTCTDALKLQTFEPKYLATDEYPKEFWEQFVIDEDELNKLFRFAKAEKTTLFSTAFDLESVDLLESIDCPMYKVASSDYCNITLIRRLLETNKPIIVSRPYGIDHATDWYISNLLNMYRFGDQRVYILHCVPEYPLEPDRAALHMLDGLDGFSDHSPNITTSVWALVKGAKVIEKHIKLNDECVDAPVSISVDAMRALYRKVDDIINCHEEYKRPTTMKYWVVTNPIAEGDMFTIDNVGLSRRSGFIPATHDLMGTISSKDYISGDLVNED